MSVETLPRVAPEQKNYDSSGNSYPGWVVVVYNDETHSYEQVIEVLIRATGCQYDEAYAETWEVDHKGRAIVHLANKQECERAASIIRSIGLKVEVMEDQ